LTTNIRRLAPRKTPVQARAVETRERILDAAARVFGRHGYSTGTTNRVAVEAGLSIGSLYQYFPSKDSILVELIRRHVSNGVQAIQHELHAGDGDDADGGLDRLIAAVIDAAISNHLDDPALHQVLFEESPRPPELLAELRALEDEAIDRTAAILVADPGVEVDDQAMAARIVVATIESVVHRVVATRDRQVDIASFRREMITMISRYLRR
jgi:AcrR family transcriptional regulator